MADLELGDEGRWRRLLTSGVTWKGVVPSPAPPFSLFLGCHDGNSFPSPKFFQHAAENAGTKI